MPAQAGIQDLRANASDEAFWILGLALLARNDVFITPH